MLNPNEFVVITTQEAFRLRQALDFLAGQATRHAILSELGVLEWYLKAVELERMMQDMKGEPH